MPKRRPPGRPTRVGRRRRDRQPNLPQPQPVEAPVESVDQEAAHEPPTAIGGRRVRPTLRAQAGAASRFVRTPMPTLDISTEYGYVVRDLRQIGALAVLAFLVLGVLAVVIR